MPGFNSLDVLAARQQFALLGGVPAVFRGGMVPVDTTVLIDRDVEIVVDNGLAVTRGTMAAFLKADVPKVHEGDRFTVNPNDPDQIEDFTVSSIISDDGVVTKVHVRG